MAAGTGTGAGAAPGAGLQELPQASPQGLSQQKRWRNSLCVHPLQGSVQPVSHEVVGQAAGVQEVVQEVLQLVSHFACWKQRRNLLSQHLLVSQHSSLQPPVGQAGVQVVVQAGAGHACVWQAGAEQPVEQPGSQATGTRRRRLTHTVSGTHTLTCLVTWQATFSVTWQGTRQRTVQLCISHTV